MRHLDKSDIIVNIFYNHLKNMYIPNNPSSSGIRILFIWSPSGGYKLKRTNIAHNKLNHEGKSGTGGAMI